MMVGCAASTCLSECDERVRVTAAACVERPGQGGRAARWRATTRASRIRTNLSMSCRSTTARRPRSGCIRLTRSRQRSSGHSAVAVLTLGPAGKAGPGLALFPGLDGAERRLAGRPLRQAALASAAPALPRMSRLATAALACAVAGPLTAGSPPSQPSSSGIWHAAGSAGPASGDLPERRRPSCSAGSRC